MAFVISARSPMLQLLLVASALSVVVAQVATPAALTNTCDDPYDLGQITSSKSGSVASTSTNPIGLWSNSSCGSFAGPEVIFTFSVPAGTAVTYIFSVASAAYDTALVLVKDACDFDASHAAVNCDDDYPFRGLLSRIGGYAGEGTYYLALDGYNSFSEGSFELTYEFHVEPPIALANTCDAPYDLGAITASTNASIFVDTSAASNLWTRSLCASSQGREVVFTFTVPRNTWAAYSFTTTGYDTVLVLTKTACNVTGTVKCNDDFPGLRFGSHVNGTLSEGTYYLVVDSYANQPTSVFFLDYWFFVFVPDAADTTCDAPYDLGVVAASVAPRTLRGANLHAQNVLSGASCATANGNEVVFKFTVPDGSLITYVFSVVGFDSVLVLTKDACNYDAAVNCNDDYPRLAFGSHIAGWLEAGTYFLVVDAYNASDAGLFTLQYEFDVEPLPVVEGSCETPHFLGTISTSTLPATSFGSTAAAADNLYNASCSEAHGPEIVYSFTVPPNVLVSYVFTVTAAFDTVLVLTKGSCGYDDTSVVKCNDDYLLYGLNSYAFGTVGEGSYYLAVDGYNDTARGAFALEYYFRVSVIVTELPFTTSGAPLPPPPPSDSNTPLPTWWDTPSGFNRLDRRFGALQVPSDSATRSPAVAAVTAVLMWWLSAFVLPC